MQDAKQALNKNTFTLNAYVLTQRTHALTKMPKKQATAQLPQPNFKITGYQHMHI